MKRVRSLPIVAGLLLIHAGILAVACQAAEPIAPQLQAGAAAVDITPTLFPVNMPGLFNANIADSAHDPLHARALVLADGTTTLAIVVVDSLGLGQDTCDEAKKTASARCGIPVDKILISATHSHSAPPSNNPSGPEPEAAYHKVLVDGIVEAVAGAHGALRPAALGAAAEPLPEEVFNRRWFLKPGKMTPNPFGQMDQVKMNPSTSAEVLDRPAGPTDPDVTALWVLDAASRKPLAVLANYSLHYVGGTPKAQVSADYYGEFARRMREQIGEEAFVAILSNGTSGDINNIPFLVGRPARKPFEQIGIVAQKAVDAALKARAAIAEYRSDIRLGMVERQVTLQRRRPTPEQIAAARAVLAITDEAERAKLPHLAEIYARRTLALAEESETVTVQLQAIRVGDLAICAIPFEVFAETGLDLKKRSPLPRTMVIELANGSNGYLPTPEQHKLGGYETWMGTCRVQEDTSVILTDNLLKMLAELAKPAG